MQNSSDIYTFFQTVNCNRPVESNTDEICEEWPDTTREEILEELGSVELDPTPTATDSPNKWRDIFHCFGFALLLWQSIHLVSDRAMDSLLGVLYSFIMYIGICEESFPRTVKMLRRKLTINRDNFIRYVTCPDCCAIYTYNSVIYTSSTGHKLARPCSNSPYIYSKQCGAQLMKLVIISDGERVYIPLKTYCYRPIKDSLTSLLGRPNIESMCRQHIGKQWGNHIQFMSDVFHGRIWKKHKQFLSNNNTYALAINID